MVTVVEIDLEDYERATDIEGRFTDSGIAYLLCEEYDESIDYDYFDDKDKAEMVAADMNDERMGIFDELLEKAKQRFPGEIITPLPHKGWSECYYYVPELNLYRLEYHVFGDKSSKAEDIYIKE